MHKRVTAKLKKGDSKEEHFFNRHVVCKNHLPITSTKSTDNYWKI